MSDRLDQRIREFAAELVADPPSAPNVDELTDRIRKASVEPVGGLPERRRGPMVAGSKRIGGPGSLAPRRWKRPLVVVAGSAIILLIAIGAVAWLVAGNSPVAPADGGPLTTLVPVPTTDASPEATVRATPAPIPPSTAVTVETISDGLVFLRASFVEGQIPSGSTLHSIAHTGTRYAVVGSYQSEGVCCAHAWVSEDGELWTGAPAAGGSITGSNAEILDVVSAGGRTVAVGYKDGGPAVWVSDDGLSWQRVPPEETGFLQGEVVTAVTTGGPGFVAAGSSIWTSADGRLWTRSEGPSARLVTEAGQGELVGLVNDVAAGPELLVAVGGDGQSYTAEGGTFMWTEGAAAWVSPDGATWTKLPRLEGRGGEGQPTCFTTLNAVTYGPAGYVAVGDCVPESANVVHSTAWRSPDGISWTQIPADVEAFAAPALLLDIATETGTYVAGGWTLHPGAQRAAVWTSDDGLTWTLTELETEGNSGISALTIHDGRVVAVGRSNGDIAIWTSDLILP